MYMNSVSEQAASELFDRISILHSHRIVLIFLLIDDYYYYYYQVNDDCYLRLLQSTFCLEFNF